MLKVNNLSIAFNRYTKWFSKEKIYPVRSLDIEIKEGEIMAIVGESGSGKSLLAHAILGLLPSNAHLSGEIFYKGEELTLERIRHLRGKEIALIPQSTGFLNPLWAVGSQVAHAAQLSGKTVDASKLARDRIFKKYELASPVKRMLPFQISGGMARRVLTASATAGNAKFIIADEPTTGLDEQKSLQSLNFLHHLAKREKKGILLITHDINAALKVADNVAVFQNGVTLEIADSADFSDPALLRHPYTRELFRALPQNEFIDAINREKKYTPNSGQNKGCFLCGRCPMEQDLCMVCEPDMVKSRKGWVRCHYVEN